MMPTVGEWIRSAERRLAGVTATPRLDAELILAHEMGYSRTALLARLKEPAPESATLEVLLARRGRGEPLAYLFGRWEFFSLELEVEPPALVPRPETEHLVEAVLGHIGDRPVRVLDLCTGTGCVAVAIAVNAPNAHVVAVDIHPRYAALAERNAQRHGVADRVECRTGDLFDAVKHGERFDAICANPPYIETGTWHSLSKTIRDFEDPRALLAGPDGLDVIRRIVRDAGPYLHPGGLFATEIGRGQADVTRALLRESGYVSVWFTRDLAGIERIALGFTPARAEASSGCVQDSARSARL